MKYLKLFETDAQYESYKSSDDFVLPNVSYTNDGNVYYNPFIESTSSYVAVDLGLPSGRLWADRNVGAESPEDYGLYFQWGDTIGYTTDQVGKDKVFNWYDYFDTTDGSNTFNKYATDKLTVLEASDDAASVNMGSDWRMPTQTEMQELIDNTTPTFIDLQGNEFSRSETQSGAIAENNLKGVRFTGSNGNSIFIPASGYCLTSTFSGTGSVCFLWSSVLHSSSSRYAMSLPFGFDGDLKILDFDRCYGNSVRAVR